MSADRGCILVVDDEFLVRESLTQVLCELGYRAEAVDGAASAERILEGRPDEISVIITDYNMPDCSGIEFVDRLKKLPVSPPVILLTAHAGLDLAIAAIRSGAFDFLTKPIDFATLRQSVDRAMRYSRLLDLEREFSRELEQSVVRITGALRENEEKLAALTAQLSSAEEQERRRIATELHDNIGVSLAFTRMKLLKLAAGTDSADSRALAASAVDSLDGAIKSVRTLTRQISPPLLYEVGLEAALECLADELKAEHGLVVDTRFDQEPVALPEEERVILFHAVRELLVNVIKHSGVTRARLTLHRENQALTLEVADEGGGFDETAKQEGFGLFAIKQKMLRLGGTLTITSHPGMGTTALLTLPFAE